MATNIVPSFTQHFEVYVNDSGTDRWVGISTVDLPEISLPTVDVKGTGVAGVVSMPVPSMPESMEATLHFSTIDKRIGSLLAETAHDFTLRSTEPNYDSATGKIEHEGVKIVFRGFVKKGTLGKFEQASETDSEMAFEVSYLKVTVGGEDILEVDKFNYIFKTGGKDNLITPRDNLGL